MPSRTDSVARYRAAFAQRNLVQELEALTARAWPPLTLLDLDGWQLRSAGGLTLQANSAWPRTEGARLGLDARLAQVEAFYGKGDTPPAVQVSPSARPGGLDAALRGRGWLPTATVQVATRPVEWLVALDRRPNGHRMDDAAPAEPAGESPAHAASVGRERAALIDAGAGTAAWAQATNAPARHVELAARILERVQPPSAFAVWADGDAVAVARGVVDGGWLGIDRLAASGRMRTPAVGGALLAALAGWALGRGAAHAYVAVAGDDAAARALTADVGFRRAYTHRYLVLPPRGH